MVIAAKHSERLEELKKKVEDWHKYFGGNIKRYEEFMRFVFKSTMTNDEKDALKDIDKPTLEFNVLESFISKLRGEFAKQQPGLTIRAQDGIPLRMLTPKFTETMKVVEAHLRAIFFDGSNDMLEYNIYTDLLAGGFSALRVFTEYVNELSFEQKIGLERVFNPTLVGFDPLAVKSHKGDGRYCFELYPLTKDQFEDEFGKEAMEGVKFTRGLGDFDWSYKNEDEEIVLVCDFYEKVGKREKIIKLTNGYTVREREYEAIVKEWDDMGMTAQPPQPMGKPRWTVTETVVRYRFCESGVLEHTVTNYKHLPIIFVDGNSVQITESGSTEQYTRPYVYNAMGVQKLKDYSGNCLANELENMVQHKFIVAKEAIPDNPQYIDAYTNVQKADVLVYNHFQNRDNPEVVLPPPREVQRTPIPPTIQETFRLSDEMTVAILGAFDNTGASRADLSGVAVARNAIQSNAASVPYIVGFIKGINRGAEIIVDLIPKYYRTPRSLPILKANGKREYVEINNDQNPDSLYMDYDSNALDVKVEVGTNFAIQKEVALQTILSLMGASEIFSQFINQHGLQILLDNIDIRGVEELQEKAAVFEQELQQQAEQAKQQQAQESQMMQQQAELQSKQAQVGVALAEKQLNVPTKEELEMLKLQEKSSFDQATVAVKERDAETNFLSLLSTIRSESVENELKAAQIDAENARTAVQAHLDISKHHHEVKQANKPEPSKDK